MAFAGFFVGLFFIFMKNFDSELSLNTSDMSYISTLQISKEERVKMTEWIMKNRIEIPQDDLRASYLINKYPDRPWLDLSR